MLIPEHANCAVADTLRAKVAAADELVPFEVLVMDFNRFEIRISYPTPEQRGALQGAPENSLRVSLRAPGLKEYFAFGLTRRLKQIYGDALLDKSEDGFDLTLVLNLDKGIPEEESEKMIDKIALVRRHILASPIYEAVEAIKSKQVPFLASAPLSPDRFWIITREDDALTFITSITFGEAEDMIYGRLFLNELRKSIGGSPSFDFSPSPPPDISDRQDLATSCNGYLSTVLHDRHLSEGSLENTINLITMLRNLLIYHIKCTKAQLNQRMRIRVDGILKILNRAKQDLPKEKKTIKGRTFTKAV